MSMPPGFPTSKDFKASKIKVHVDSFGWHRDPGSGGKNYGVDLVAPHDAIVVDYEVHVESDHNTKGAGAAYLVLRSAGIAQMPIGVHIGHRLTPDRNPVGKGASYTGKVHMKIVSLSDWLAVAMTSEFLPVGGN